MNFYVIQIFSSKETTKSSCAYLIICRLFLRARFFFFNFQRFQLYKCYFCYHLVWSVAINFLVFLLFVIDKMPQGSRAKSKGASKKPKITKVSKKGECFQTDICFGRYFWFHALLTKLDRVSLFFFFCFIHNDQLMLHLLWSIYLNGI